MPISAPSRPRLPKRRHHMPKIHRRSCKTRRRCAKMPPPTAHYDPNGATTAQTTSQNDANAQTASNKTPHPPRPPTTHHHSYTNTETTPTAGPSVTRNTVRRRAII